jgi:hypothetical protein
LDCFGSGLVTFVLNDFRDGGAKGCVIRAGWEIGMASNYFFTAFDPDEPLRFGWIPGNFHTVGEHGVLLLIRPEQIIDPEKAERNSLRIKSEIGV